jgi:tetratricopeptide (TPR) repeat protein
MAEPICQVLRRNFAEAMRAGRRAEAASILERLAREDPLSKETRTCELELLIQTNQRKAAASLGRQLLELFPESARVVFLAGLLAYKNKSYAAAERYFRESSRLSTRALSTRWLGKALTELGRFDEAESLLVDIAAVRVEAQRDLAWLYERKGDSARALSTIQVYCERRPKDVLAFRQRQRLLSRQLDAEEIEREVRAMQELGERSPPDVMARYVETLLDTGRGQEARAFVRDTLGEIDVERATKLGWAVYQRQAHDLAVDLFLVTLAERPYDYKLLGALENAAVRAGRIEDVVAKYRMRAEEDRRFYGRMRALERKAKGVAGERG